MVELFFKIKVIIFDVISFEFEIKFFIFQISFPVFKSILKIEPLKLEKIKFLFNSNNKFDSLKNNRLEWINIK